MVLVQFVDAHSIESVPNCRMALVLWFPRLRKSTKRVEHNILLIIIIIMIIIIIIIKKNYNNSIPVNACVHY